MEDLPRSDRPFKSSMNENIDKVKEMVPENRHFSLRKVVRDLSVSHESIRKILYHQLGIRRMAARLVPRELNFLRKTHR